MKNFQFLGLLLLLAFSTLFSSCKKEEELTPKEQLVGTWNLTDTDFSLEIPGFGELPDSIANANPLEGLESSNTKMEMKANGTFVTTSTDPTTGEVSTQEGTWELLENDTKIKFTGLFDDSLNDPENPFDQATVDALQTFAIKSQTSKQLVLENEAKIPFELEGFPLTLEMVVKMSLTFTK